MSIVLGAKKKKNKADAEVSKMQSEDSPQTVIWKFWDLKSKNIYSPVQKKGNLIKDMQRNF